MKKMKIINAPLFALLMFLTSCVETIEPDLKSFDEKIVIEALVTNTVAPHYVKVTKAVPFYSNQGSLPIDDAIVVISDDAGNLDTLSHMSDGRYETSKVSGTPGIRYHLLVIAEGKDYEATSIMPRLNTIDSAYATYYEKGDFLHEENSYYVSFVAKEPQDTKDFYLWKFYKNGELLNQKNDIMIASDELVQEDINGMEAPFPYQLGDTAKVEMYSLTEEAYKFYSGLNSNLNNEGGFFSSPPANPSSNITNGALGLFQTSAVETIEYVIK